MTETSRLKSVTFFQTILNFVLPRKIIVIVEFVFFHGIVLKVPDQKMFTISAFYCSDTLYYLTLQA